jgi:tetratricopeptide (TPR) repeat protein
MGRIYLKLEQPDEAIKAFERAVRLNDELASAHYELAFLHEAEGRLPQANKHLVSFGKYARHTPQSLWLGIRMQRVLGNQDALASYRLALKNLFPGSEEYRLYTESKSDFQTKSDAEAVEMPISAMDEGARGESKAVPPPEVPSVGVKAPPKGAKSEEGVDSLDDEDEY